VAVERGAQSCCTRIFRCRSGTPAMASASAISSRLMPISEGFSGRRAEALSAARVTGEERSSERVMAGSR
jgi:hypothetical protein